VFCKVISLGLCQGPVVAVARPGASPLPWRRARVGRRSPARSGRGINVTAQISGNIVQSVAGNQEINVQHGISGFDGDNGISNVTITNNTLRDNTSTSRPLNVEILNGGAGGGGQLNVTISGHSFSNNIGQGGGPSLLRVNEGTINSPTLNVTQLTPTDAVNANELDNANGLSNAAGQVTVGGSPNFGQPLPTALAAV
jgi:hypothetical protein